MGGWPAGVDEQIEARHEFVQPRIVAEHVPIVGEIFLNNANNHVSAHRLECIAESGGRHDRLDDESKYAGRVGLNEVFQSLDQTISRVDDTAFGQSVKHWHKLTVEAPAMREFLQCVIRVIVASARKINSQCHVVKDAA
ncbi:protein of unknown function [Paraburkholderia kururiensis]